MKSTTGMIWGVALLLSVAVPAPGCGANAVAVGEAEPHGVGDVGGVRSVRGMATSRAAHTATLLSDGKVLVAGGFTGGERGLASAEVFDPATNAFAPAGSMRVARASHSATMLPNGKVLIAGGFNGDYLASAELYDPATRAFAPAGRMVTARAGHVATLLDDGRVLLAGGVGVGWTFLADAELYDPATNTFTPTGRMASARESHTATLLPNGKVLITGGHRGRRAEMTIYASAELYDPATGSFTETGSMTRIRHKHDAALLEDGRVLVVGGADERDGRHAYTSVEVYDPATGAFREIGNLKSPRYKLQGTTVVLEDGRVLIAGGADRVEVFDPATKGFTYAAGDLGTIRLFATATRLRNGRVLIVGGYDSAIDASSKAWIYEV